MKRILLLGLLGLLAVGTSAVPGADPETDGTHRVEYPLKTPRSRDPVLGGSKEKIQVTVWIPKGVKVLRGGLCNPFSKGDEVSKHWQAACRLWQFAYIQVDFDAVKKDEFPLLARGLADLAKTSGHPELEHLPLCFTGMSRGGGMSAQLAELMPERTLAAVPVCLEVGPTSEPGRQIPMITVFGEKDGQQMNKLFAKLPPERREDARWGIAVQWARGHEFGQANNLSFVFFDDVQARRLPKQPGGMPKLTPLAIEDGWVGDPFTWGKDGKRPTIQSAREFTGDREKVCWFPTQRVAATWQAFVGGSKDVTVTEPAGLGDGQKFVLHPPGKVTVKLNLAAKLKPEKVIVWDAHEKLAERSEGPWEFEVPLKPGIHALHATVQEEGKIVRGSRPHTIVVGE